MSALCEKADASDSEPAGRESMRVRIPPALYVVGGHHRRFQAGHGARLRDDSGCIVASATDPSEGRLTSRKTAEQLSINHGLCVQSNDDPTETMLIYHLMIPPGVEGQPPFVALTYAVYLDSAEREERAAKEGPQVGLRGPKLACGKLFGRSIGLFECDLPTVRRFTQWVKGRQQWQVNGTGG